MTIKTNTLQVRRIDLLQQLEERYAWMTKEKEKYEALNEKYVEACTQYFIDLKAWEARIPEFVKSQLTGRPVEYDEIRSRYTWSSNPTYTASQSVSFTLEELEKLIPGLPVKPDTPEEPEFLRARWPSRRSYSPDGLSVYKAVYQAIQVLKLSDDETVAAATYQIALEVL